MLEIKNLHARVGGAEILRGIDLSIAAGETHAVMGPNGSGKSTLSYVLAGRQGYEVTQGDILFRGRSLLGLPPNERAVAGLFLAMQYPTEIPGVTTMTFLRTCLNAQRKARGEEEVSAPAFLRVVRERAKALNVSEEMLKRALNVGFSGGEKKRLEVLQLAVLDPRFAVLDETDSGLDIDALRTVADGVNAWAGKDKASLVITHYQRLLDHIVPTHVHILAAGRIFRSGGPELAHELERVGYDGLLNAA